MIDLNINIYKIILFLRYSIIRIMIYIIKIEKNNIYMKNNSIKEIEDQDNNQLLDNRDNNNK